MSALEIQQQEDLAGCVTFRLKGTLDRHTAELLQRSLAPLDSREVILDFSQVREFKDTAVAVLTRTLARPTIQLRGLTGHPTRMLRYFGVGTSTESRAYYTPEELRAP